MKRSRRKPTNYRELHKKFGVEWNDGIIITYGDTVHCKWRISRIKYVHEKVHSKRQLKMGTRKWWDRYLKDEDFRLKEELAAYREECQYVRERVKNIKSRKEIIDYMAKDLSSCIYGNIISFEEARKEITK